MLRSLQLVYDAVYQTCVVIACAVGWGSVCAMYGYGMDAGPAGSSEAWNVWMAALQVIENLGELQQRLDLEVDAKGEVIARRGVGWEWMTGRGIAV